MKFEKKYLIGITVAVLLIVLDFLYFFRTRWFFAFLVLSISIGWIQFWVDFFNNLKVQKEIETKFLEFVRNLVSTVKSGISIPQSIMQACDQDYGALTPYVIKLRNQIEWGISIHEALIIFSNDTGNDVIKRAVEIVIEAEKSGGDIENVLDSVTESVLDVKKLKEERKATTYSQIVQGYIVFFVFIIIMLVLQLKLFPQLETMGIGTGLAGLGLTTSIFSMGEKANLDAIFFSLVLVQGFFAGIMVGKFSEGTWKQGLLHSLILITTAALVVTTVKGGI